MNSEGEVIKRALLSAVSPFPLIKPRVQLNRVTGWFNSFDINNWHHSLRKVKNCNKGKSGSKDFLGHYLAEKEGAFFRQRMLRKMHGERAMKKKKSKKG